MKYVYFVSDAHLGSGINTLERELKLVKWLESIKPSTEALYLMGDIFDFWFEWSKVVPRGYTRLFGKLIEFTDAGIQVHFFTGNHDIWSFGFLEHEIGMQVHRNPITATHFGKKFYLAHGDGLGPGNRKFLFLKSLFTARWAQWLFARLHPNLAIKMALDWSGASRKSHTVYDMQFKGEQEPLVIHANEVLKTEYFDYFVFGHRHVSEKVVLQNHQSELIFLGDWITFYTFSRFDGNKLEIVKFEDC
ncbi:MAG TPA: UDP-2,3-diacylglucosamine hydrolase [Bacteroidales bacterium]|nr:UDP-2,3-diacylglucosamine hydrolase [Bacteroidales bacterium]